MPTQRKKTTKNENQIIENVALKIKEELNTRNANDIDEVINKYLGRYSDILNYISTPIENLKLRPMTYNKLKSNGIETIGDFYLKGHVVKRAGKKTLWNILYNLDKEKKKYAPKFFRLFF